MRVLLIDNCQTFTNGLKQALSDNQYLQVIGQACTAREVKSESFSLDADVAVVDVDLPDESGIEVCRWLTRHRPGLVNLMLTSQDWDVYLAAARAVHAAGLLLRTAPPDNLVTLIRQAAISHVYSAEQLARCEQWDKTIGSTLHSLRKREWQLMWQMAEGQSNRKIAKILGLSENTVEKHVSNILTKFNFTSRSMLLALIITWHLDVLKRLDDPTVFFK